jgi:hypothetical protein
MKTPYLTNPEGVFNKDLLETIDINELQNLVMHKFPQLQAVIHEAIEETIQMMKMGVDVSDPLVITPVGWIAQKYPEISEYCNQILTELVEKQLSNPLLEIEDQTMTGEF